METSTDGKLVRLHHSDMTIEIPGREGIKYTVQRQRMSSDDGPIIVCNSIYVSRRHCQIFRKHKAFWVKDLSSSNGTYLNGTKIEPEYERELRFGDTLGMGIGNSDEANTQLPITDKKCYIFLFEKVVTHAELFDLDAGVAPPLDKEVKTKKSNVSKDADSDEDIQFVGEVENSSSASSSTKSPKKSMPPPPPPPIISNSFALKSSIHPTASISQPSKSTTVNGHLTSTKSSDSPVYEDCPQYHETKGAKLLDSPGTKVDVQNKRPLRLQSDEPQPPTKRSKPEQRSCSSSSDDSSDGLEAIVAQQAAVSARAKHKRNIVSSGEDSDNSSDEKSKKLSDDQPSWINIPTEKHEPLVKTKKPKPLTVEPKSTDVQLITKSTHVEHDYTPPESIEDIERRKYDELKNEALRDIGRVRLQQIIQYTNGRYTLTNPTYSALKPSCRTEMQRRFRESLQANKDKMAQHKSSVENDDDVMQGESSPVCSDTDYEDIAEAAAKRICSRELSYTGLESPEDDFSVRQSPEETKPPEPGSKIQPPQRGIQYLDDAPSPRFALKAQSKFSSYKQPAPQSTSKYQKVQKHNDSPATSSKRSAVQYMTREEQKQARIQKLKEMELKKQQEKAETLAAETPRKVPQPAKIKLTSKNRNQGLMESIIDSKANNVAESDTAAVKTLESTEPSEKQQTATIMDPRLIGNNSRVIPRDDPRSTSGIWKMPGDRIRDPRLKDSDPSVPSGTVKDPRLGNNIGDPRLRNNNPSVPSSSISDPRLRNSKPSVPGLAVSDPRLRKQDNNFTLNKNNNLEPYSSLNAQTSTSNRAPRPGPSKLKPCADVILSPSSGIGNVAYKEKQKIGPPDKFIKKVAFPSAVPEDDIYKRILTWRPPWLEEQKNMKEDPPLLKDDESLTTTLINYESFDAYFKVYYLLLLSEMWATISSDSGNRSKEANFSPNLRSEYNIKIDDMKRVSQCPLFNNAPCDKLSEDDWVLIRYHTWIKKTGDDIDFKKDFVQLKIKGKDSGSPKSKSSNEKIVFGFCVVGSEKTEPISRTQDCDPRLKGKGINIKDGWRFSESIVCKFGHSFIPDKAELGNVTRLCSLIPKIREFRVLNKLQNYELSRKIISPREDTHNSWQTWVNKNSTTKQHELISTCRTLNLEQQAVVRCVSHRVASKEPEFMLLHGPPGTGKTTTIVGLVLQLLVTYRKHSPSRNHRILICTPSNAAIDEIMRRLREAIQNLPTTLPDGKQIEMVRIGDQYSEDIKEYAVDVKVEKIEEERSTASSIKAEITCLENEIEELKAKIADLKKEKHCNPISLEARLGELKENEDRKRTLKKDLNNVLFKGKLSVSEKNNRRVNVLKQTQIICTTLSSSGTSAMRQFLKSLPSNEKSFLCCIVDEASQTTEPETLLPLVLNVDKLLLVGDPRQLGATVRSKSAEEKKYEQSLFSRHFQFHHRNKSSTPVMTLTRQYRMHLSIVNWPNNYFYEGHLNTFYTPPDSKYPFRPYYFLNISSGREHAEKEGQIENVDEVIMVKAIVETVEEMLLPVNLKVSLGIITPYAAQKQKIRNALKNIKQTFKYIKKLDVDTVDGFQGQERDIIILSCVRTDATGFLKSKNRLNVALTRAKHSLYIIGDKQCLFKVDMWRCLIQDAAKNDNTFDVNSNFRHDLKLLKTQLCNNLKKRKTAIP